MLLKVKRQNSKAKSHVLYVINSWACITILYCYNLFLFQAGCCKMLHFFFFGI
jgi:hypothetical protein